MPFKKPFLLFALAIICGFFDGQVGAQTFKTLHSFSERTGPMPSTNSDGCFPQNGLLLSGNTLYGTAPSGGTLGGGIVFAVNIDGTGFTNLHDFNYPSDGILPDGGLILASNILYGTSRAGGSWDRGTVFALNIDGTGFNTLHHFSITSDGADPACRLLRSGNRLFGTAGSGGSSGFGTIFAVNIDGTGFTNLHDFTGDSGGSYPLAGLIQSGNILYGTSLGGRFGDGTVFSINADGTGFTNLHHFAANSDGSRPFCELILSGNILYGTALEGGGSYIGTVFALNTDGTGFTNLHNFEVNGGLSYYYTNSDGANPASGLILSHDTLYGTTRFGGRYGNGTVFQVKTNGTGFSRLYSFSFSAASGSDFVGGSTSPNSDGAYPTPGLLLSGNTLYGTASRGGSSGHGTVFSLTLPPPQLTITRSAANIILTWPTDVPTPPSGFSLQSTTNLVSSAVWSAVSPAPDIVNGQNIVTNLVSGSQNFYRLGQ